MEMMKVQQMIEACRAAVLGSGVGEIDNIVRDSREVKAGSLFVAIVGENMDGHKFIPKAWELGAEAVLAQQGNPYVKPEEIPEEVTEPEEIPEEATEPEETLEAVTELTEETEPVAETQLHTMVVDDLDLDEFKRLIGDL